MTRIRQPLTRRTAPRIQPLEARLMFDAAAATEAHDRYQEAHRPADLAADARTESVPLAERSVSGVVRELSDAKEVVFFDGALPQLDQLLAGVRNGVNVVVLDASTDGIAQISDYLSHHGGLSAVHIVSHGADGSITLGGSVTLAGIGSITLAADGSYSFHPDADWNGSVPVITYTTTTGASATLSLSVSPVDDAATFGSGAGVDSAELTESATASTLQASGTLTVADADVGQAAIDTSVAPVPSAGARGHLGIDSAGAWTYTVANADIAHLNLGETLTETFTVRSLDGSSHAIVVQVHGINPTDAPAPSASADTARTLEDQPVSIDVLANDQDVTAIRSATVDPSLGTVQIVDGRLLFTPAANLSGPVTLHYVATDGSQDTAETEVTVEIVAVNDAPVAGPADGGPADADWNAASGHYQVSTPEDTPRSGTVAGHDADGDTLSYRVAEGQQPAHGSVALDAATGRYVYTPDADFHGSDRFVVVIDDGQGGRTEVSVDVTVTPVNDAPQGDGAALSTSQDTPWQGVLTLPTDPDGDTLSCQLATPAGHGQVEIDADGHYRYTPAPGFHGSDRFQVLVSDGHGGELRVWVDVTVLPAPTIDLPASSDLGSSDHDDTTTAAQITLAGDGTPGQTLQLRAPDGHLLAEVQVDAQGHWSVAGIDMTALTGDAGAAAGAPGAYTFQLTPVQADGTPGHGVALTVIRELPVVPVAARAPAETPTPTAAPIASVEPVPAAPTVAAFDSALRPPADAGAPVHLDPGQAALAAPQAVRNDLQTNDGEIYTRPSGFRTMVMTNTEASLKVYRGVDDQVVPLGRTLNLQVPADTFVHTQINETVLLQATQADGRPLPAWLRFDGKAGTLVGAPPAGWNRDIAIKLVARDGQGREAVTLFRIQVSDGKPQRGAGLSQQLMRGEAWAQQGRGWQAQSRPLGMAPRQG